MTFLDNLVFLSHLNSCLMHVGKPKREREWRGVFGNIRSKSEINELVTETVSTETQGHLIELVSTYPLINDL